jgi:hypothetical protein
LSRAAPRPFKRALDVKESVTLGEPQQAAFPGSQSPVREDNWAR